MISDLNIFPNSNNALVLRMEYGVNFGVLSLTTILRLLATKEKLHFSLTLICSFYCCLVKEAEP